MTSTVAAVLGATIAVVPLLHRAKSTSAGILRVSRVERSARRSIPSPVPLGGAPLVVAYTGEYDQARGFAAWTEPSKSRVIIATTSTNPCVAASDEQSNRKALGRWFEVVETQRLTKGSKVEAARSHIPNRGIWLFDIDSRPLFFDSFSAPHSNAVQLPSVYLCPFPSLLSGLALAQTIWSFGYEQTALQRKRHYLVGHGLYLPPGFPGLSGDHLAEDLELGYRATGKGFRVDSGFSTGIDLALSPSTISRYMRQSQRWMRGEFAAIASASGPLFRCLRRLEVVLTWSGEAAAVLVGLALLYVSGRPTWSIALMSAWLLVLLSPLVVLNQYHRLAACRSDVTGRPLFSIAAGLVLKPFIDTLIYALVAVSSPPSEPGRWKPSWGVQEGSSIRHVVSDKIREPEEVPSLAS